MPTKKTAKKPPAAKAKHPAPAAKTKVAKVAPAAKAPVKAATHKEPEVKGALKKKVKSAVTASAQRSMSRSDRGESETGCREAACEGLATSAGYCRLHYIKNWKKIKRRELVLKEGKLNKYIEELVSKYPEKYIDAIRHDLSTDKEFSKVVRDLELDESIDDFEAENEAIDSIIDNIRRDIDDDTETF